MNGSPYTFHVTVQSRHDIQLIQRSTFNTADVDDPLVIRGCEMPQMRQASMEASKKTPTDLDLYLPAAAGRWVCRMALYKLFIPMPYDVSWSRDSE